ncbi:MAG: hypothetical protein PHE70_06055, partial [Tepidanaerobacteraceae bacterium]|nr:hypothetical protein [Tepidanaerobacteraceae bacterium]
MTKHKTNYFNFFFIAILLLSFLFLFTLASIKWSYTYRSFLNLMFFLAILVLAQQLPVTLPFKAEVTVDFAIVLSIIIIYGSKISILLVFLSTVITEFKRRKIMPFYKSVFNTALYIIMVGTSSFIYEKIGGVPGHIDLYNDIFRILILIFTYLFVNVGLVTIALSLLENQRSYMIFFNNFKWALPNYVALAPLGILLAM